MSFRPSPVRSLVLLIAVCCAAWTGIDRANASDAAATPPGTDVSGSPTAEQLKFFEAHVRPLLIEKCFKCHGAEKQSGALRLDSRAGILTGGDSGPAIVPGAAGESLLVEAINYASNEMPPDGKLADDQIAVLTKWVEMGAPWPAGDGPAPAVIEKREITDADREHWCFRPLTHPTPPLVAGDSWSRTDIDRFILARLTAAQLAPQSEADKLTLIRRATQLVTGLPPTLAEIDAFLSDESPAAYETLIDRLLDSPRRGEHLARFWLDLVRYAESDGYKADYYRPDVWRYRDYVVRSFNEDRPYDRFLMEQLAGDELAPTDPDAVAATGYFRHGIYEYNQRDAETQWQTMLEDITDTTGDVFLAMGMGCAKCHDHKFDPILQTDYYQLQAFFTNLAFRDGVQVVPREQREEHARKLADWQAATAGLRAELDAVEQPAREQAARKFVEKFPPETQAMWFKPAAERTAYEEQIAALIQRQVVDGEGGTFEKELKAAEKQARDTLLAKLAEFDHLKPEPLPTLTAVRDVGLNPSPLYVPGKPRLGEMTPAFLTVLGSEPPAIVPTEAAPHSTGRRAALARWLARPDHPLTSRVIVNRIWQQHFGAGLVTSCSDFGRLGEQPSHPELLDWLATEFVSHGWSIKWLQREILMSTVFRQGAGPKPEVGGRKSEVGSGSGGVDPNIVDPSNRLLWRFPVRRLFAEQIRDALLAVSGELDLTEGGPGVESDSSRRSIYLKVLRNKRDDLLAQFDFPDRITSAGDRNVTTTPTQSLMMINSDWTALRARAFLQRLQQEFAGPDDSRVRAAYRLAYGRDPTEAELVRAVEFLEARQVGEQRQRDAGLVVKQMPLTKSGAAEIRDGKAHPPLRFDDAAALPQGDFTIEAVVLLDSLYEDATVRTITSHWDGDTQHPGWSFGVTSTKSKHKPRNLILQLAGNTADGQFAYEVLASNIHLELSRPYYVACSVRPSDTSVEGVTFRVRDLLDPAATVQTAAVAHRVVGGYHQPGGLVIGGRNAADGRTQGRSRWDGLIDELRLTAGPVPDNQFLRAARLPYVEDPLAAPVVGHWTFDSARTYLSDAAGGGHDLNPGDEAAASSEPFLDLCHVLLNSNEFLYVD